MEFLQDIVVLRDVIFVSGFWDPRRFLKFAGLDLPDEFDFTIFARHGLRVEARRKQAWELVADLTHQDLAKLIGQVALIVALHLDVRDYDDVGRTTYETIQQALEIIQPPIPHGASINLARIVALLHKDRTELVLICVVHLKTRDRIKDDRTIWPEIMREIGRDFGKGTKAI